MEKPPGFTLGANGSQQLSLVRPSFREVQVFDLGRKLLGNRVEGGRHHHPNVGAEAIVTRGHPTGTVAVLGVVDFQGARGRRGTLGCPLADVGVPHFLARLIKEVEAERRDALRVVHELDNRVKNLAHFRLRLAAG